MTDDIAERKYLPPDMIGFFALECDEVVNALMGGKGSAMLSDRSCVRDFSPDTKAIERLEALLGRKMPETDAHIWRLGKELRARREGGGT